MRSKLIWTVVAGLGLSSVMVFANWEDNPKNRPIVHKNAFAGCEWQVETANREVTAECRGRTSVISGGCRLGEGSFRQGFPEGVSDGSSVRDGTGWTCETTANQPITAAALCCPVSER